MSIALLIPSVFTHARGFLTETALVYEYRKNIDGSDKIEFNKTNHIERRTLLNALYINARECSVYKAAEVHYVNMLSNELVSVSFEDGGYTSTDARRCKV
jgi:hypothetical protein